MSTKNTSSKKRINITIDPQVHADATKYAPRVGQDFSGLISQLLLREMRDQTLMSAKDIRPLKELDGGGQITHGEKAAEAASATPKKQNRRKRRSGDWMGNYNRDL